MQISDGLREITSSSVLGTFSFLLSIFNFHFISTTLSSQLNLKRAEIQPKAPNYANRQQKENHN